MMNCIKGIILFFCLIPLLVTSGEEASRDLVDMAARNTLSITDMIAAITAANTGEILTLETAGTSGLPKYWSWTEPFKLVAADGKTYIHGVQQC